MKFKLYVVMLLLLRVAMVHSQTVAVYFGTYSEGIYQSCFDTESGKLTEPVLAGALAGASYFVIDSSGEYLYSVSEAGKQGSVAAFRIEEDLSLTLLNKQPAAGSSTCYVSLDRTGKFLLVANYGTGTIAVYAIANDGSLADRTGFAKHESFTGTDGKLKQPRAHSIITTPDNKYALVADLGLDKIMVYDFDFEKGGIKSAKRPFLSLKTGSGPRHTTFNSDGRFLYCINELNSTVSVFSYQDGNFEMHQTISTIPEDYIGFNACAEVLLHPNGKFLYSSNRGHDSIAVFKIDATTGKLTFIDCSKGDINFPRGVRLSPAGNFCFVANQKGDSVVVFKTDDKTGLLKETKTEISLEKPVFVKFYQKP